MSGAGQAGSAILGSGARPTVLQVGEGRFLRAFLGALVADARAGGGCPSRLVLTAPRPTGSPRLEALRAAGGSYRIVVRDGGGEHTSVVAPYDRIVDAYAEPEALLAEVAAPVPLVVVSNTTEAGLAYRPDEPGRPVTYPARLTTWLEARRRAGATAPTCVIPCELLADNGALLRAAVLRHARDWGLDAGDLLTGVSFAETLVDRIVTSEDPADALACFTEPYLAWYIGGAPDWVRRALPLDARFVHFVPDVTGARERKVRLLNGTHTLMAVLGLQMGVSGVLEALADPVLGGFVRAALQTEGVGSFPAPERAEAEAFAAATLARLLNPGIRDTLARLALQLSAKVAARWTPILDGYRHEHGRWPSRFVLGLAAYLRLAACPEAAAPVDLAEVDDPARISALRGLWSPADPGAVVAAAAAAGLWPGPAAPDLLAEVAGRLRDLHRRGVADGLRGHTA